MMMLRSGAVGRGGGSAAAAASRRGGGMAPAAARLAAAGASSVLSQRPQQLSAAPAAAAPLQRQQQRLPVRATAAAAGAGANGSANGGAGSSPPSAGGTPRQTGGGAPGNSEPSERVLRLWRGCGAVCFDVDCEGAAGRGRGGSRRGGRGGGEGGWGHGGEGGRFPRCCRRRHCEWRAASPLLHGPPPLRWAPPHQPAITPSPCAIATAHTAAAAAGTVTVNDSLDLLAEFMGVGDAVAQVTNKVTDEMRGRVCVCVLIPSRHPVQQAALQCLAEMTIPSLPRQIVAETRIQTKNRKKKTNERPLKTYRRWTAR